MVLCKCWKSITN